MKVQPLQNHAQSSLPQTRPVPAMEPARARPRHLCRRVRRGRWLHLFDPTGFEWTVVTVALEMLPPALAGLRIVHLSDLHLRPRWLRAYDELIDALRRRPPDLIAISGDFVDNRRDHRDTLPTLRRLMSELTSRLGIFAILGNHDGDLLGPRLLDWGVNLVDGRVARLHSGSATLEIIGIPSVSRLDLNGDHTRLVPPRRPGVPRILLSHFPDSIRRLQSVDADLILAGHTHGGQVCLPGGCPIITHDSLPRRMARGVHELGDKLLIVHRGLGFANLPIRLFCPAEVIEIQLDV